MSSLLCLGFIGNTINIFMFTRKESLRNSCSLYILTACILNVFNLCWGIISALYNLDHVDPTRYTFFYCKIRHYILHSCLMMSRTMTVLGCIDRFALCSSSMKIRSFSNPKVAIRVIIGVILFWPTVTIFLPFSYTFNSGTSCSMSSLYTLAWAVYSVIIPGLLTPGLMIVFGGLAITNRRNLHNRLNSNQHRNKRREYTLLLMLFSEIVIYCMSTAPFPALTLYQYITKYYPQTSDSLRIRTFMLYVSNSFLIYIYPSASFYIYIAVSRSYRKECKRALLYIYMRLTHRGVIIGPTTTRIGDHTVTHQDFRA